jgi:flagellar protein FliS
MKWNETEKTYRRAAVQNATPIGLVIILYDLLVGDLRRAVAAMRAREIEVRCVELKHAFLVLQQLEGSLDMEKGGEAARGLSRFYSFVRAQLMQAQLQNKPELLERQIELILDVRTAWMEVDAQRVAPSTIPAAPVATYPSLPSEGKAHGSWEA